MTTLKNTLHDSNNGLDYTLVNDHYLPNLTAAAPAEQHPTGRWGRLHKMYLKEHHPIRYNQLLLSGELGSYLAKLDKQAEEQLALIIRQMQEAEGVDEALKVANVTWGDYTKASDKTTNKEGKKVDVSTYTRHPQKETVVIDLQEFSKNKEYPLVCDSNVILYISKIGLKQGYTLVTAYD